MKHVRLIVSLALLSPSAAGCSSSSKPAREPAGTPPSPAVVTSEKSSPPAETAQPAAATSVGTSSGTLTIDGKAMPIKEFELREEDGEYYFYVKAENTEGIALTLGKDLSEGAKVATDYGVTGHVLENGKIINVGDASKMTFELTKKALGTWEKPGKCSGKFTAETKYKSKLIKASGSFEAAPCMRF